MRPIAVIDAETDPFRKGRIPQPFIWGYYNGEDYREFTKTADLARFLSDRDEIVYAHNGGKFDFHFLLPYLDAYDDISVINGRLAVCRIGVCELRDSYLIIPQPLSAYAKDEIDYACMEAGERWKPANKRKISSYLRSDCVNLYQMVAAFIEKFGLSLTAPGAAMKTWLKMAPIDLEPTDANFYAEMSPYYYGGRVQCFRAGVLDVDGAVYDINSAYPFAMLHKHPYSANYERAGRLLRGADFVRLRCRSRGALPFRGEAGGGGSSDSGLCFPCDDLEREYFVTRWEFEAARETGAIDQVRVIESVRFMKHVSFESYINRFWTEREDAKRRGDVLGGMFAKLMMNALYGKFAANPSNYRNYMIVPGDQLPALVQENAGGWRFGGEFGPWLLATRDLADYEQRYYNVATGASITGFVRAMLWRAIHSSEGVIYCDTDSVTCERAGAGIVIGDKLGQWKHEGDFDRFGIAGKKLYVMRGKRGADGKRHNKTASKGARLTEAELWKVARGGLVEYESEAPTFSVSRPPDMSRPEKSFIKREIRSTV